MGFDLGQGLKGAGGGALAGSAFGPWGTGIGAGLGFLGGAFLGGDDPNAQNNQMMMDYYRQLQGRNAPQAGPAAQSAYSGFRANQAGLVSRLEAMANGQGPSLARQQFEQATDRNMRGQQAMAASGRGGPLSQLTAANNMGMLGANAAQGSALARTNEQMQAIGQLGGVIAQGRGADEGVNMFNAGQKNNTALANLDARLRAMGMNDQARLQILSQLSGNANASANTPGMGDQILAGGAGMFSMAATQNAGKAKGMSPIAPGNPGAGGFFTPSAARQTQGSTMNPFQPNFSYNSGYGAFNR